MVSVFQSAMDAISVPSPLEPNVGHVEPALAPEPAAARPPCTPARDAAAEATVPVYLSPKSLTFAGVTTASGLIAGFVHNTTNTPVL